MTRCKHLASSSNRPSKLSTNLTILGWSSVLRSWHSLWAASLSLLDKFSVATRFRTHNCDVTLCLTKCTEPWAPLPMRRTSVQRASGLASIVASAVARNATVDSWPDGWSVRCAGQLAPARCLLARARGGSRLGLQGQLSPRAAAEAALPAAQDRDREPAKPTKKHCNGFTRHVRQEIAVPSHARTAVWCPRRPGASPGPVPARLVGRGGRGCP